MHHRRALTIADRDLINGYGIHQHVCEWMNYLRVNECMTTRNTLLPVIGAGGVHTWDETLKSWLARPKSGCSVHDQRPQTATKPAQINCTSVVSQYRAEVHRDVELWTHVFTLHGASNSIGILSSKVAQMVILIRTCEQQQQQKKSACVWMLSDCNQASFIHGNRSDMILIYVLLV